MAYSRASIPLFAICMLAVAVYLLYVILTKNIFQIESLNNSSLNQPSLQADASPTTTRAQDPNAQASASDFVRLKKVFAANPKKPAQAEHLSRTEQAQSNSQLSESDQIINTTQKAATENSLPATGVVVSEQNARRLEMYQHKILWDKYSARVPSLYSRPTSEDTQAILSRVGEISMNLDLLKDRGMRMVRVEEAREELINIAIKGEREGARALSFQYIGKTTDALTWAMIANAIAPNDYFLTICAIRLSSCSEDDFALASELANSNIVNIGFRLRE